MRLIKNLTLGGAVVIGLVFAVGAVALAGSASPKLPPDPWHGLSDSQRQAEIQAVYDQQAKFIREFNASGRDPHSLHREPAEAFYAGPDTLDEALRASDAVVLASVRSVTFEPVPGQWLGRARVTVDVVRDLKGRVAGTAQIVQSGSPAPTTAGAGELQELDVAPILLPGDRVLLMLMKDESGSLTPVPGAGIVYIEAGRTRGLDRSPVRSLVNDQTESEALELYSRILSDIAG